MTKEKLLQLHNGIKKERDDLVQAAARQIGILDGKLEVLAQLLAEIEETAVSPNGEVKERA